MCVYKPLHNSSDNLEYNELGVGLGLDLSISLLGLILFPFFLLAQIWFVCWLESGQSVGHLMSYLLSINSAQ